MTMLLLRLLRRVHTVDMKVIAQSLKRPSLPNHYSSLSRFPDCQLMEINNSVGVG